MESIDRSRFLASDEHCFTAKNSSDIYSLEHNIYCRSIANKYTQEELMLMKTQDAGYILQKIQSDRKVWYFGSCPSLCPQFFSSIFRQKLFSAYRK